MDEAESPSRANDSAIRVGTDKHLDLMNRQMLIAEVQHLRAENAELTKTVEHLEIGLASSREIGAALGIVMATYKVTNEQAFRMLIAISQDTHRKLRDLAADIVFTGGLSDSADEA